MVAWTDQIKKTALLRISSWLSAAVTVKERDPFYNWFFAQKTMQRGSVNDTPLYRSGKATANPEHGADERYTPRRRAPAAAPNCPKAEEMGKRERGCRSSPRQAARRHGRRSSSSRRIWTRRPARAAELVAHRGPCFVPPPSCQARARADPRARPPQARHACAATAVHPPPPRRARGAPPGRS